MITILPVVYVVPALHAAWIVLSWTNPSMSPARLKNEGTVVAVAIAYTELPKLAPLCLARKT